MRTKSIFAIMALLALSLVFAACGSSGPKASMEELTTFAQCLTENDVTMYGAFWCPHCARVKKQFGAAFKEINYVECDPRGDDEQSELCLEKGIENYATFEFADGSRLVGEPTFAELSEKTGCAVPGAGDQ